MSENRAPLSKSNTSGYEQCRLTPHFRMECRVCAASNAHEIGEVEYYSGFAWTIFDCRSCSCRFTKHDAAIYNRLHSTSSSIYGLYRELAAQSKYLFEQGDLSGLKGELSKAAKYSFVIESVEQQSTSSKLLEVGCARGYLTSYFILAGYDITGSDVSPDAIAGAREAFGDHFIPAGSTAIQDRSPYDIIYHVGTIGCVGDPLSLTSDLMKMLKPGGQLLFNAPNADSCWLKGQLWIDAAPPPDVVTLFRPGFWRKHFSTVADVLEEVEMCSPGEAFVVGLKKLLDRQWKRPNPLPLDVSAENYQKGRPESKELTGKVWHAFERGILKIGRMTGLLRIAPSQPSPFGLFVKMTKK
jgi:SAM-dependent methyltransferase